MFKAVCIKELAGAGPFYLEEEVAFGNCLTCVIKPDYDQDLLANLYSPQQLFEYRWTLLRTYCYNKFGTGAFVSIENDTEQWCLIDLATFNLHFKKI